MDDQTRDPGVKEKEDDALVALFLSTGFGDLVRYDHLRSQWYYWDSPRWRVDKTKRVYDMVREHVNYLYNQSSGDKEMVKMLLPLWNWGKKESFLKAMSSRREIAMVGTEWDADPYMLGFENGIMDLRTGHFDPNPGPDTLISRSVGYDYDPKAACPRFVGFIKSIFPEDQEVQDYVCTLLGYCMTGLQREQKFWMWVGRGANGKGILARTMKEVLGDYFHAPSNTLYMRTRVGSAPSNQARPDLVKLQGARFTPMSEPPGGQFDEEMLKSHTGEDVILARDLYGKAAQMAEFPPTHKIVFLTNDPPKTDDVGVSMRRRVRVVRFNEDFSDESGRSDKTIEDKVKAERQGIANLLVKFAVLWIADGLTEPQKVLDWSEEYISDNDPLAGWLHEDCDVLSGEVTGSAVLYGDYTDWCARHGIESRSQTAFGIMLAKRFRKERARAGSMFYGIRLKPIEKRAGDEEDDD